MMVGDEGGIKQYEHTQIIQGLCQVTPMSVMCAAHRVGIPLITKTERRLTKDILIFPPGTVLNLFFDLLENLSPIGNIKTLLS